MLFVLTGDVQTGKTRWLERLVAELGARDACAYGVIAPGTWVDHRKSEAPSPFTDANGFEKTGIDNVLLPGGETVAFARRVDLAEREGSFDATAQSARAQLGWHISDAAIEQVNAHFARIGRLAAITGESRSPGLLVVDELGRLELERGGGLTEALQLLEAGPAPGMHAALIVVREALLPRLDGRFPAWGDMQAIHPDDESMQLVFEAIDKAL